MEEPDLLAVFVHPLHRAGVRYMITGSVASIQFGEPRLTMDVDLVISLQDADVATIAATYPPSEFYCPPSDVIRAEIQRPARGHFNVIHLLTGLKADFYPSRRPEWVWAWERRLLSEADGHPVYFAPPEYVILSKLEFYREGGSEKHLRDIRGMLAVSAERIDVPLIQRCATELGVSKEWRLATDANT